jgi:putative spermidine/putrescine transport system ATP-binding protein
MTEGLKRKQLTGAQVELMNLTKHSGRVVAVDDIKLQIRRGEFITLLGPSGSGKTTTLMMIAGFVLPTSGDIRLNDASIVLKPPYKRDIGMVFQNYALFPHMTVADNIAFPLQMRRVARGRIAKLVAEVLELVHLPGYEQRYPRQLSGGQQQRIALARALVFEPSLLLMDEPLGALDKKLREAMQLEIKHIQEQLHITVVYVTHDQEEALVMSDRIAVMNQGRIEQLAAPDALYEHPTNRFVADFIGESNFLTGTVTEISDGLCQVQSESRPTLYIPWREGVAQGQTVDLALRPERVIFTSDDNLPNRFPGTIEAVIYVGDSIKYAVRIGSSGEDVLTIKRPTRTGTMRYEVGDAVQVGWEMGSCCVI